MSRPRLLDLFCGAGGAAMGYHRAGFDVVGVDVVDQPRYPFKFYRADAMEVLGTLVSGGCTFAGRPVDAIHASPPCQAYSSATAEPARHPDLYGPTRSSLLEVGVPWVIENVIGAPYTHGFHLCGSMFGLEEDGEWIQRHRNFETSWLLLSPLKCRHPKTQRAMLVTGHAFISEPRDIANHSRQGPFDLCCRLMGIDWMTRKELVQSIPPAYTRYIGEQLMQFLGAEPLTPRPSPPIG